MITNTAPHVAHSDVEQENRSALTAALQKQGNNTVSAHRLLKWFGALSTSLLCAAALAPHAFGIRPNLQPWVFVLSVFWLLSFCAGMFDL